MKTTNANSSSTPGPTTAQGATGTREPPFFRTQYNHDPKEYSDRFALGNWEPSLTVQSMSEDADINVMMARMGVTGKMPDPPPRLPTYQDYDEVFDFRTALERVQEAQTQFMAYPARLRAEFDNDPGKFLAFCSEEANKPRMKELGLLKPDQVEPPLSRDTTAIVDALKAAKAAPGSPPKEGTT